MTAFGRIRLAKGRAAPSSESEWPRPGTADVQRCQGATHSVACVDHFSVSVSLDVNGVIRV